MSHPINPRYLGRPYGQEVVGSAAKLPPRPQEPPPPPPLTGPTPTPPDIPAIVTVEPGQRILLVFKHMVSAEQARLLIGSLRAKYPGLDIDALGGVDGVLVLPPHTEAADQ